MKSLDVESGQVAGIPRSTRLGDILLNGQFISKEQLQEALKYQRIKGGRLGVCLIKLGFLTEEILHSVLSRQFGLDVVEPAACEVDAEVLKLVTRDLASRLQTVPIRREANILYVAVSDPHDVVTLDELKFRTGLKIMPLLASEVQIREGIDRHYGSPKDMELKKVFEDLPDGPNEEEADESLQII